MAIFFVVFAVVFTVGLIVIPVIEAAEATTGAGGGGGGGEGTPTTRTPASAAAAPPSSSTYYKRDFTDPSLSAPNDMILQAIFGGNILLYSVTAQDNRDGNATLDQNNQLIQGDNVGGRITIKCNPSSQNLLPVGNHKVECSASDHTGNSKEAHFIVTVIDPTSPAPTDTIAPNLAVPNGLVITTDNPTRPSYVEFNVAATDNVDGTATLNRYDQLSQDNVGGSITMACNPSSPYSIPVGDNTVTCSVVDAVGNRGTASFTVSVVSTAPEDTIAPVIEVNFLPSRSPAGATTYTVVATDNVDGTATLGEYDNFIPTQDNVGGPIYFYCEPSSGSVFSAGDNIRCGGYDDSGNGVITTFTVPTAGVPQAAALNATTLNATAPLVDATTPSPLVNATTPLAVEEEEEAPPPTTITPEEEEEEEAPPPTTTTEEEDDTTTDEEGGAGDTGGGGGDGTEDGGGDEPPATTTEEGGEGEGADEGAASP